MASYKDLSFEPVLSTTILTVPFIGPIKEPLMFLTNHTLALMGLSKKRRKEADFLEFHTILGLIAHIFNTSMRRA